MEDPSLSNRVVHGIHMVLRQALQQAVNERIINHSSCGNCRILKLEKKEMKIIPPERICIYRQQAKEKGMLPMFYLELTSGPAPGRAAGPAVDRIWTWRNGRLR